MTGNNCEEYEKIGTELCDLVKALEPFANNLLAEDKSGGIANIMK